VAITSAADQVAGGNADVVVAGGSESLTNVPLTLTPRLARALIAASQAKSLPAKAQSLAEVRLSDIAPVAPGIRETSTGLTMGESAERMAAMNGISRRDQDAWALGSHQRAAAGWDDGRLRAEVGPVYLDGHAVRRAGLTLDDIDLFEMHEAFAAQVLSTLVVLEQNGVGRIPREKLNVMGGSIALGHPFGATGARVVLTLANEMKRRGARYGLASVCAAGGNGAAIVLERAA